MKGSTKLFRIFGIDVKLHFSWWFIFILLAWGLSAAFFPNLCGGELKEGLFAHEAIPACQGLSSLTYWFMGISAAFLLFASVLMHELSHSLVAKAKKIKVESITLFFFGGVAAITDEDMKPGSEFMMAIAGPLLSIFLGVIFLLINKFYLNGIVTAITFYLYFINFLLAGFNLIPGFPLDGGRAFRAILHWHYKDIKKATRIAVTGGKIFAGYMVLEGILNIFGIVVFIPGGLWFIFLGGFLYFIAGMSYEQVVIKESLSKLPLKDIIEKKFPTIEPGLTFTQAIKKSYSHGQDSFIVQKGKNFLGILDLKKITKMPLATQKRIKISQILLPKSKIKPLHSKANCYRAFRAMLEQDLDLLPVIDKDTVKGIITRKALMHRLILELKYGVSLNHELIKEKIRKKRIARKVKKKTKKKK